MELTRTAVKQRPRISFRSVILVLGVILITWLGFRHIIGLLELGYVDSAIVGVRALVADENKFAQNHPSLGYSCSLAQITADRMLASGQKNSYAFELANCEPVAEGRPNKFFTITARPLRKGMPAYCSDQSGVVKSDYDGSITNCVKVGGPL